MLKASVVGVFAAPASLYRRALPSLITSLFGPLDARAGWSGLILTLAAVDSEAGAPP